MMLVNVLVRLLVSKPRVLWSHRSTTACDIPWHLQVPVFDNGLRPDWKSVLPAVSMLGSSSQWAQNLMMQARSSHPTAFDVIQVRPALHTQRRGPYLRDRKSLLPVCFARGCLRDESVACGRMNPASQSLATLAMSRRWWRCPWACLPGRPSWLMSSPLSHRDRSLLVPANSGPVDTLSAPHSMRRPAFPAARSGQLLSPPDPLRPHNAGTGTLGRLPAPVAATTAPSSRRAPCT